MNNNENSLIDTSSIDSQISDLATQVLQEKDVDKTKDLIALFNWNISKKNTSRILKLNSLYDDVTDQMILRFKTRADQFTNSDLLDYLKVVQGAIDTSTKNLSQIEEPPTIVQNNTQINVNVVDTFDRDSKERILAAIQATLKSAQQTSEEQEVIESTATEITDSQNNDSLEIKDEVVSTSYETIE